MSFRFTRRHVAFGAATALMALGAVPTVRTDGYKPVTNEAEFRQAMKDVSNWGRWGADDELGASNLITPAKTKAGGRARQGRHSVSLSHNVIQEDAADAGSKLDRVVVNVSESGASDRYQYSGTYHGAIHSHLDAVKCHVMFEGKGYNGRPMDDIKAAGAVRRAASSRRRTASSRARRPVRRDPASRQGDAAGLARTRARPFIAQDLEALERMQRVKVSPGDVILLYTGRWKRRAALGPWKTGEGLRRLSGRRRLLHEGTRRLVHRRTTPGTTSRRMDFRRASDSRSIGSRSSRSGVSIFDNLDLEEAAQTARRLKRWEFLFTAAPLRIEKGMGSPLNPIATF